MTSEETEELLYDTLYIIFIFCLGLFTDPLPVELKLINPSRKRLSFKIKTTAPRAYTVRPNSGIVPQNDKTTVIGK